MESQDPEEFCESADASPIYCSGVARAIVDSGNVHIALYQERVLTDGSKERVIVLRLVIPARALLKGREIIDFEVAAARHISPPSGSEHGKK